MRVLSTHYTVSDYCEGMKRNEIIVNREYQRSDKVWPPAAKSFLIETILLGFPVPKLSLYQQTDLKSRKTYKEIVDGQQRSQTVREFYDNKLRLSRNSEVEDFAGKLYRELDEEYQQAFIEYSLSIDVFVSATDDEIKEAFRRVNSYTVPLNPEEQRHAQFQGAFKWFIYRLTKLFDQNLKALGVFGQKQLIRMADAKLFSEIVHALMYGIRTTKRQDLDKLYRAFDKEFDQEPAVTRRLTIAVDRMLEVPEIHNGPLMKHYNFYSLVLAYTHMHERVDALTEYFERPGDYRYDRELAAANLSTLSAALEESEAVGEFAEFIDASSSRTNVADQRIKRFKWFCQALQPQLL